MAQDIPMYMPNQFPIQEIAEGRFIDSLTCDGVPAHKEERIKDRECEIEPKPSVLSGHGRM